MPHLRSPIRILWAARYDYAAGDVLAAHHHAHWQALCLLSGTGNLQIGGGQHRMQAGLALLAPGTRHGLRAHKAVRSLDVKFHCTDAALASALAERPAWMSPAPTAWAAGIEAIVADGRSGDVWSRARAEIRLSGMLLDLLPIATADQAARPAPNSCGDPLIDGLRAQMRVACDQAWDQDRIARCCGYSYRQVSARTRSALGRSPQGLLEDVRLDAAEELLLGSDYTVAAVAIRCGFANGQHLSRRFRRRHDISPAAWRGRVRERIGVGVTFASDFRNPVLVRARR